jgi:ribose 5-phosphate isomerase B
MADSMRFYFGSDHAAVQLRRHLAEHARAAGHTVEVELGPMAPDVKADYPAVAAEVARRVAADPGSLGLLVCGSGLGVAMAANRVAGVRAAPCTNEYLARMSRAHNDANVLCLGARVVGLGLAESIFDAFCAASFEGGRHAHRVAMLSIPPAD